VTSVGVDYGGEGGEREILITAAETAVGRRREAAVGGLGLRLRGWVGMVLVGAKTQLHGLCAWRGPMRVRLRRAYNYEIPGIN